MSKDIKDIKSIPLDIKLVCKVYDLTIRSMYSDLGVSGLLYYSNKKKAFVFFEEEGEFIYIQFHKTSFDKLTAKDKDTVLDEYSPDGECTLHDYFMSCHKMVHHQVIR